MRTSEGRHEEPRQLLRNPWPLRLCSCPLLPALPRAKRHPRRAGPHRYAPEIDSVINDLDDAASGKCLHCGLTLGTISDNERKALALSYNETRLRRRLEEARETLVDRKLFGFGRFDFGGNRLIGDNGLVLQWQTRPEPDQPESHRNSQNGKGYVFLLCPAKPA